MDLQIQQLKQQNKILKKCVKRTGLKRGEIPQLPAIKEYNHIIPSSIIYITDLLIGINIRSSDFKKCGKIKVIINTAKYDIVNNLVLGESNLLYSYFGLDDEEVADELSQRKHPIDCNPKIRNIETVLRKKKATKQRLHQIANGYKILIE